MIQTQTLYVCAKVEDSRELWLDLPIRTLSASLSLIYVQRSGKSQAHAFGIRQELVNIGEAVEALYMGAVNAWLDAEYSNIDMAQLIAAETTPEDAA